MSVHAQHHAQETHLSYAMNTSYNVLASRKEKVAVGVAAMEELSNTATLSIHTCCMHQRYNAV